MQTAEFAFAQLLCDLLIMVLFIHYEEFAGRETLPRLWVNHVDDVFALAKKEGMETIPERLNKSYNTYDGN